MEINLSPIQSQVLLDHHRMKVFVAGRRSGKSFLSVAFLVQEALAGNNRLVFYVAPTIGQARSVAWGLMKEWLPSWYTKSWNETRLTVMLANGSQISLRSADNPDAMRGVGLDALVMDEIADMKPEVWYEVLRPACSDRRARVMFVGTPKGLSSWAFDVYKRARDETDEEWISFTCTTAQAGFVPKDELSSAQKDLDPRVYRQEYEASFESPSGVVYPFFDEDNVQPVDDDGGRILVGMDFNVSPGMSAVLGCRVVDELHIWDEIFIPGGTTFDMADELDQKASDREVICYPDPSGNARKTTSPVGVTDFTILKDHGFQVKAPRRAPLIVDRVNLVNRLLCNAEGIRRLYINSKCNKLIESLSTLGYKEGTSQPDKTSGLDHMSDAIGYLVCSEFPMRSRSAALVRTMGVA